MLNLFRGPRQSRTPSSRTDDTAYDFQCKDATKTILTSSLPDVVSPTPSVKHTTREYRRRVEHAGSGGRPHRHCVRVTHRARNACAHRPHPPFPPPPPPTAPPRRPRAQHGPATPKGRVTPIGMLRGPMAEKCTSSCGESRAPRR
ncbi:unnamed protein product, partial [Iphiclides podalirius]